jgi:hypothetical protein
MIGRGGSPACHRAQSPLDGAANPMNNEAATTANVAAVTNCRAVGRPDIFPLSHETDTRGILATLLRN